MMKSRQRDSVEIQYLQNRTIADNVDRSENYNIKN